MRPQRRIPQHYRIVPRLAVSPYDQHEPRQRRERVKALPWTFAEACDLSGAPVIGDDAHRMHAEEEDEAENQINHECPRRTMESDSTRPCGSTFAPPAQQHADDRNDKS